MDSLPEPWLEDRLSRIATEWTAIRHAHGDDLGSRNNAIERLIERYQSGAYRYLLAASGDRVVAQEVWQEFALRFCRGDYRSANPEKGRFRDFLKTILVNLLIDWWRAQDGPKQSNLLDRCEPAEASFQMLDFDARFVEAWREALIDRVWYLLKSQGETQGHSYYEVLRWRAENVMSTSSEMASALNRQLRPQTSFTDASVRQLLKRARQRYGDLLIAELAISIQSTSRESIEQELIDLNLLNYCKSALERYQD